MIVKPTSNSNLAETIHVTPIGSCQQIVRPSNDKMVGRLNLSRIVRLSPYLRFLVMLVAGISLANVSVIAVSQSTQSAPVSLNPFLEYADLLPGRLLSESHVKTFSCWGNTTYYGVSAVTCRFEPPSDIFSDVQIDLTNGIIRRTIFTMRDTTMKIGDLVLLFGSPHFRVYPRAVSFFWDKRFNIVLTTARGNSPAVLPVGSVIFTDRY